MISSLRSATNHLSNNDSQNKQVVSKRKKVKRVSFEKGTPLAPAPRLYNPVAERLSSIDRKFNNFYKHASAKELEFPKSMFDHESMLFDNNTLLSSPQLPDSSKTHMSSECERQLSGYSMLMDIDECLWGEQPG